MTRVPAEVIVAERLDLVPLRVDHADEMAEALADPALHTFIGGEPATAAALRSRYERMLAGPADPDESWLNWVLRLRGADCLTGYVQATVVSGTAEIAWVVGTPWQGRGLATEAARALVGWLERQAVRAVIAHVHPEHAASAAVAAAAGLERTTRLQDGEVEWRRTV